ncbi:MAG: hypothetical protein P4L87_12665 [Formivibrio sp.]|nr:hypothetical protein [Formivibrio sp.]
MKYTEQMTLNELIDKVKSSSKDLVYCVYGTTPSEKAELTSICVIDDYPEINDEDEEIFPDTVTNAGLVFWYRDELIEDVISNAKNQDAGVTNKKILEAINYYDEHDSFMPLK